MDERLGQRNETGAVIQYPALYANGAPFTPRTGITTVKVGRGYFYALQPGIAVAPNHAELGALAAPPPEVDTDEDGDYPVAAEIA